MQKIVKTRKLFYYTITPFLKGNRGKIAKGTWLFLGLREKEWLGGIAWKI